MWDVVRDILSGTDESVNPNETELKIVEKGEDYPLAKSKSGDRNALELNLDALDSDQRERIKSQFTPTYNTQEGLFETETNEDIRVAEAGITDEEIEEIVGFYDDFLCEKNADLLRRSLSLRKAWESEEDYTSKKEVGRRRDELASEFGHKAYSVTNLCSSGYFDDDGYVSHTFRNVPEQTDLENVFEEITNHTPFTVYIGGYDDVPEIKSEIIEKVHSRDQYLFEIEFIDVRAQGGRNRSTLENVWVEIQNEAERIRFEGDIDDRESTLRIYVDSITGL